ncbi:MAG: SRPBCC domain-containing protein, partial [Chloroflexi bacterium]|nr:SRPBCC domain-containing protein [Chloroflexota bacterium]
MTQQIPEVETTLRVTKTIAAPRDRVFKAWTEPEMLKQWMGPEASC